MERLNHLVKKGKLPLRERIKLLRAATDWQLRNGDPYLGCIGWTAYKLSLFKRRILNGILVMISFPWMSGSLKAIESKAGTAVSNVFQLYGYLLKLTFVFALLWTMFVILPMALFSVSSDTNPSQQTNINDQLVNSSQSAKNFLAGTGTLETSILFYGHYKPGSVDSGYDIPLAYFSVLMSTILVTLAVLVWKIAKLYEQNVVYCLEHEETRIGTELLSVWDHTITAETAVCRQKSHCALLCKELLDEYLRRFGAQNAPLIWGYIPSPRSSSGRMLLSLSSTVVFLGIVATGIYFLHHLQLDEADIIDDSISFWRRMLPPAVCTVGMWFIPVLQRPFRDLVVFQDSVSRMWWNVTISIVASAAFAGAYLITFVVNFSPETQSCWETRTGQELYRLILINAIWRSFVDLLWIIVVPTVHAFGKISALPSVNVVSLFVGLAYEQSLMWIGFPFVPLLPSISFWISIIRFFMKEAVVLFASSHPLTVVRLSQASYMKGTLFVFLLSTAFTCIVLFTRRPSNCGPFQSTGNRIYNIIRIKVQEGGPELTEGWNYVFMRGAVVPIVVALILAIVYLFYRFKARRFLMEELQYNLDREQHEFRQLLRKSRIITHGPLRMHTANSAANVIASSNLKKSMHERVPPSPHSIKQRSKRS